MKSDRPASVPAPDRVTCTAEPANLPALLAVVADVCRRERVDAQSLHDLTLIAEEACVNVMHHAYPPGHAGSLALEVATRHEGDRRTVVLTFEDQGRPFNPLDAAPPDTTGPAETRNVGGLGVHLIRQLSDRQHYRRDGECANVFTIEKNLPPTDPS
jgi:anti-sigma regulatory factor (Ser/Thr protein kinase)